MIDERFVLGKVDALFSHFAKERGGLSTPVDPVQFADSCGVLNIEYRHMIPEAVLTAVEGGFVVYLQDNFILPNRNKTRERFSLAHELAHTFFYDRNQEVPKPMKGSPRGEKLERLCHLAASEILLPSPLLKKELEKRGKVESAEALLGLVLVAALAGFISPRIAYVIVLAGTLFGLTIVVLRGLLGVDLWIHVVMLAGLAVAFALLFARRRA